MDRIRPYWCYGKTEFAQMIFGKVAHDLFHHFSAFFSTGDALMYYSLYLFKTVLDKEAGLAYLFLGYHSSLMLGQGVVVTCDGFRHGVAGGTKQGTFCI